MAFKLDFNKLRDPAHLEQVRKEREAESARLEAHEKKLRGWVNVALDGYDHLDEREREFVRNCRTRVHQLLPLSEAQEKWLGDIALRLSPRQRTQAATPAAQAAAARGGPFSSLARFAVKGTVRQRETPETESSRRLEALRKSGVLNQIPRVLQEWLDGGHVLLAGPDSDYLPETVRAEFSRKRAGGIGTHGLAVCVLRDDGQIVIALDNDAHDAATLQHELIHATQITASEFMMEAAFRTAAGLGSEIVMQIIQQCGGVPDANSDYRDVDWTASACRTAILTNEERYLKNPNEQRDALMGAFDLALMVHPTKATLKIGKELGVENPGAIVAALHAHFMMEAGFSNWQSDIAREIVAHNFEANWHPTMEALATDALRRGFGIENEASEDFNRPRG